MRKIMTIILLFLYFIKGYSLIGFNAEQNKLFQAWIKTFSKQHQFEEKALKKIFEDVTLRKDIVHSIKHPYEAKPWFKYKQLFLTPTRIKQGVNFWKEHETILSRAEKMYGVPAEIIVAILGIETRYGEKQGEYRVLDSLTTLAFAHKPRSAFFKKELEAFLLLSRKHQFKPKAMRGSYAGAIGQPQFMPSSYLSYAVDFDGSGYSDLIHSQADAIGSIGNYLKRAGWQADLGLVYPAYTIGNQYKRLQKKSNKPSYQLKTLSHHGIKSKQHLSKKEKYLWLIFDEGNDTQSYWLGTQNFYAITRYNTSQLYAMAAIQLSQSIKNEYKKIKKS